MCQSCNIRANSAILPTDKKSLDLDSKDVDEPVTYSTDNKAFLSIKFNTPQGPLRLRNVGYLFLKQPMQEVLLSRPFLNSLGLDLEKHLIYVRDAFHDIDFFADSGFP